MHEGARNFIKKVKSQYPELFKNRDVLDVGSLDVNGNNREHFENCNYWGVDIIDGPNVDQVIEKGKLYQAFTNLPELFMPDFIICTEVFEHSKTWEKDFYIMGGYASMGHSLLITCAGPARPEHGTFEHSPESSPATNDYYENRILEDFDFLEEPDILIKEYGLDERGRKVDIYIFAHYE